MDSEAARNLLFTRIPSASAVVLLRSLDATQVEIYGVEGFMRHANGDFEAKLDLIFDVSADADLTSEERILLVRTFVEHHCSDDVHFEVYGE